MVCKLTWREREFGFVEKTLNGEETCVMSVLSLGGFLSFLGQQNGLNVGQYTSLGNGDTYYPKRMKL
jgi:hypothetical protein